MIFNFSRLGDIEESVQNACIEHCSSFACLGLNLLIEASKSDDTTDQQVISWFNMVLRVPVILSGLLEMASKSSTQKQYLG